MNAKAPTMTFRIWSLPTSSLLSQQRMFALYSSQPHCIYFWFLCKCNMASHVISFPPMWCGLTLPGMPSTLCLTSRIFPPTSNTYVLQSVHWFFLWLTFPVFCLISSVCFPGIHCPTISWHSLPLTPLSSLWTVEITWLYSFSQWEVMAESHLSLYP